MISAIPACKIREATYLCLTESAAPFRTEQTQRERERGRGVRALEREREREREVCVRALERERERERGVCARWERERERERCARAGKRERERERERCVRALGKRERERERGVRALGKRERERERCVRALGKRERERGARAGKERDLALARQSCMIFIFATSRIHKKHVQLGHADGCHGNKHSKQQPSAAALNAHLVYEKLFRGPLAFGGPRRSPTFA